MENIYIITAVYIKVKFSTTKPKARANITIFSKVTHIKETGKMTCMKVMVVNSFKMDQNMKDSLIMA